jgi:hypothetical protein
MLGRHETRRGLYGSRRQFEHPGRCGDVGIRDRAQPRRLQPLPKLVADINLDRAALPVLLRPVGSNANSTVSE